MIRFLVWLWQWFFRFERSDLYRPRERQIYRYWDGKRMVRADPIVLYKRMMEDGPELFIDAQVAGSKIQGKAATDAHNSMVAAIRKIFDVQPMAEGGLAELEAIELLNHFLGYCSGVKKNSSRSATSSPTTVASTPSSGAGPTTPSSSGSGSTASVKSSAGPGPSPSAPAPASAL